ncbi:FecR domain-containing protein [Pseudoxanthomonas sp. PXM02]|uniref:FecR family protein n=1 Tax=Pseudoxanthomonas sp. PXM02 TaxID=2769294 RepID=UPI001782E849|nr:FecR domain-containing protein [Pseudoxanthomonas sp. PXM02]MBD9478084.1 FecR domain-containing protein [Pseudoxanthomonas sp. PXM02]
MTATEEAAHWHLRQREGALGADEQQRFMDWLVASPDHLREYLAMARVTAELGDAVRSMPVDAETEAVIAGRSDHQANVIPLGRMQTVAPRSFPFRQRAWATRMAVAATLLLAIATGWQAVSPPARHYTAPHGAPRVFALDDGTVLHLNAESEASVSLGLFHRRVSLTQGQASFVVAPGRRPFTVRAAGMEVRDIGTTFDVSLHRDQARFGVTEGRIHVIDDNGAGRLLADLSAGQAARIAQADRHVQLSEEDTDVLTGWWERRVVFRDEPLRDIADRFNRMNRVRLQVDDNVAGALRLTGNLQADDLASLRAFLDEQPTLATTATAGEIRVRSRHVLLPGAY